ncbi:DUF799 domain-containing protein [Crenobacter cavernae]|uniref:DUF799 domain-containing protein n=1 Tax=Crenobacter cavernae TaxID=2290923 RepID=A0A345Y7I4_9NEIS|nr:DUF799 domain-containing protein [Crenobacter cavernae]AXK39886.1 hypothetical protein DWG20_10785 [Crenobacter cavernae]
MRFSTLKGAAVAALVAALASGCATPQPYDYTAFKQSRPKSVLILPPQNSSPEVKATYSMLSQMTHPLAESGYYVLPVTLVDETFKQNGLNNPGEIHTVAPAKLRDIFGADAALYVDVKEYGSTYTILSSEVTVAADAKLVDLQSGSLLWQGSAVASSAENQNNSGGGLVGMLVVAVIKQITNSLTEQSHSYAGITSQRLLTAGRPNGMLYGPSSPHYGKD